MCANAYQYTPHAEVSSKDRALNFGTSLYLHLDFVYASSEGSGESAHMLNPKTYRPMHGITVFIACAQMPINKTRMLMYQAKLDL